MSQLILTSSLKKGGTINTRPCKQALTTNQKKAFSHASQTTAISVSGIQPYRWANLQYERWTMNTFLWDSKHLHKGLSAGTCLVQWLHYHISSLPSGGRQRDRGTISTIKTVGDSPWTGWLSKSNVALEKIYQCVPKCTKFCTLSILANISWVSHCAKDCWW